VARPTHPLEHQRRRILAAALVLAALGLFAAAGALAFDGRWGVATVTIDPTGQTERLLPVPTVAVPTAEEWLPRSPDRTDLGQKATRPANAKPKPKPVRRELPPPERIRIPAIGVSAPVIPLGLNPDRSLEVPQDFGDTGWFKGGPEPGERGAAVIVGHVDSRSGPAVFYRLRALRAGDSIWIRLRDGSSVRYVVTRGRSAPKNRFPTKLVYARTTQPTLRLVTCDGAFDTSTGHYVDNYIVFARLA
jgi:sortase (surface protein transpeptidase)